MPYRCSVCGEVVEDIDFAAHIIEEMGWARITDPEEISAIVDRVVKANDCHKFGWLMGQIMQDLRQITGRYLRDFRNRAISHRSGVAVLGQPDNGPQSVFSGL